MRRRYLAAERTIFLAVLARRHGVPFYVAAPLSSVDPDTPDGGSVSIEERDSREVTHMGGVRIAPEGVAWMTDIDKYLSFALTTFIAFGVTFEVPVVVIVLVRAGVISIAKLKEICDLADKYNAMVMVDDSHAVGFVGKTGRGTPEHCGVTGRVDILTGTLGKALGGASGRRPAPCAPRPAG